MRNLLAANFLRLRKNKLFWGLLAFSAGFGALVAFNYYEMSQIEPITLDGAFFIYPMTACILTAVFIPLFWAGNTATAPSGTKCRRGAPVSWCMRPTC